MRKISLIGGGQCGLLLGFALLDKGYSVTLYTDRSAEQVLAEVASHLPGLQASPVPTATDVASTDSVVAPASQLVQGLVQITPSHEVSYPNATESTLAQLAKSIEDGTIVLKPFH